MLKQNGIIRLLKDGEDVQDGEIEMKIPPTPKQLERMRVRMKDLCPCGSGRRFKYCCYTGRRKLGGYKA